VAGRPAGRRGRPDLADIECDDEVDNEESNQYIGIVKKLMTRARDTQTCSETVHSQKCSSWPLGVYDAEPDEKSFPYKLL